MRTKCTEHDACYENIRQMTLWNLHVVYTSHGISLVFYTEAKLNTNVYMYGGANPLNWMTPPKPNKYYLPRKVFTRKLHYNKRFIKNKIKLKIK